MVSLLDELTAAGRWGVHTYPALSVLPADEAVTDSVGGAAGALTHELTTSLISR